METAAATTIMLRLWPQTPQLECTKTGERERERENGVEWTEFYHWNYYYLKYLASNQKKWDLNISPVFAIKNPVQINQNGI